MSTLEYCTVKGFLDETTFLVVISAEVEVEGRNEVLKGLNIDPK